MAQKMDSVENDKMKEGKMYYAKARKLSLMTEEATLKNGTLIMTDMMCKIKMVKR